MRTVGGPVNVIPHSSLSYQIDDEEQVDEEKSA